MNLLVTGGAGYIGSIMAKTLRDLGHNVLILDNFSTGNEFLVNKHPLIKLDLIDRESLFEFFNSNKFDGVFHFAAYSIVSESMEFPEKYYRNNIIGTLNLIEAMIASNQNNLVFSSSAAIFGNPITTKVHEDHPKKPINPYGKSKLIIEGMLEDMYEAYDFNSMSLRYFNAAGADKDGEFGELHDPETHLIPNILRSALSDDYRFRILGNDYATNDGTCIRDYIHVNDLCEAHLLGLERLIAQKGCYQINLGNGSGFSVLEVLRSCERVLGKKINFEIDSRRAGDPPILVSDSSYAKQLLDWEPCYSDLDYIVESAWIWQQKISDFGA